MVYAVIIYIRKSGAVSPEIDNLQILEDFTVL